MNTIVALTAAPVLRRLPLTSISFSPQNPRSDIGPLEELKASYGVAEGGGAPLLVQFPVVQEVAPDSYQLIIGARRIEAANQAGFTEIFCLVYPGPLDPADVHRLRLIENYHRAPIHPLDEALGIKIAWAVANADSIGLSEAARAILTAGCPTHETLTQLLDLLYGSGFNTLRPAVAWGEVLDGLGMSMPPYERKRMLRVLRVEPDLFAAIRKLELSEASIRSVGQLESGDQHTLVAALTADPRLARNIRRICDVVGKKEYTLAEALDEARGKGSLPTTGPVYGYGGPAAGPADDDDEAGGDDDEAVDALGGADEDAAEAGGEDLGGDDDETPWPQHAPRQPRGQRPGGGRPSAQFDSAGGGEDDEDDDGADGGEDDDEEGDSYPAPTAASRAPRAVPAPPAAPAALDAPVFALTELVTRLSDMLTRLRKSAPGGDLRQLPQPWRDTVQDALDLARVEIG